MPKNRFIHIGVLIIAATALLYASEWILTRIAWILPYAGVAGAILVVIGVFLEMRKEKVGPKVDDSAPGTGA